MTGALILARIPVTIIPGAKRAIPGAESLEPFGVIRGHTRIGMKRVLRAHHDRGGGEILVPAGRHRGDHGAALGTRKRRCLHAFECAPKSVCEDLAPEIAAS